ncbi:protein of unknown function [Candidatus Filomicrobium marinum]|uniref:Uncharacterized protein n=1 Tax=Candidatus Filomicrobium marinum TaxID=1608628 RepID=A0A0D6JEE6_9HYPH|nr:protein of unknown function [Candidatus Filomicrobium marinum]CPR17796.1 protein of unknown function [Candidatus Filomicrobium marinum]
MLLRRRDKPDLFRKTVGQTIEVTSCEVNPTKVDAATELLATGSHADRWRKVRDISLAPARR